MKKKLLVVGAIALTMMLSGCGDSDSSGSDVFGNKTDNGGSNTYVTEARTEKPTEAAVELTAPSNVKWKYDYDSGSLVVNWNAVSGATKYEIDYGQKQNGFVDKNSCVVTGVSEGESGTVKVRAVCESGNHADYSDWSSVSYKVEVNLSAPDNFTYALDGKIYVIKWNDVKGASKYEIEYTKADGTKETMTVENAFVNDTSANWGNSRSIKVRAVKNVNGKDYYSSWNTATYTYPTRDLNDYSYRSATLLDKDGVVEWAKLKGYKSKVVTDGDVTVVDVHYKDDINGGFWSKLGRAAGAAFGAWLTGYTEGVYDTVTSDFSSVQSTLNTLFTNEGLGDYINKVDDSATGSANISALAYGVQTLFEDTDIHYTYYFNDVRKGAICCQATLLMNGRDNYEKDNYSKFEKDKDGSYHLVFNPTGQNFISKVETMTAEGYKYWSIITYPEK